MILDKRTAFQTSGNKSERADFPSWNESLSHRDRLATLLPEAGAY
jgi:hypothetical protein